ncbi:hypothetical protein Tco_1289101 [Tanacetum coccineum]
MNSMFSIQCSATPQKKPVQCSGHHAHSESLPSNSCNYYEQLTSSALFIPATCINVICSATMYSATPQNSGHVSATPSTLMAAELLTQNELQASGSG